MKKLFLLITATILSLPIGVFAQKPAVVVSDKTGWHKIGETTVSFDKESDEVDVLLADKFAALKFTVTDATIELLDLDVIFEDKDKQNIVIGSKIKKAGESSPEIDLKGVQEKNIDRIIFRYRTLPNQKDKKAHVEIWGKKTNTDKKETDKESKKDKK